MTTETLAFKNRDQLAEAFHDLTESPGSARQRIRDILGPHSMVDVLERFRDSEAKVESEELATNFREIGRLFEQGGPSSRFAYIRLNPHLAHVADGACKIRVGDDVYDVFDEEATKPLLELMPQSSIAGAGPGNYEYNESPSEENWLVQRWPMGPNVKWSGYPTKYFATKLDGRDVVIQLWKGRCPQYYGAGGIGAEVGIYKPDPLFSNVWWPDYKGTSKKIKYSLTNPNTKEVFVSFTRTLRWWLHVWMTKDSYEQYKIDHEVPAEPEEYDMWYWIEGISKKGDYWRGVT